MYNLNATVMKKSKMLGWALIALTVITSCSNDSEEFPERKSAIKLTSEISPTRVTSLDYQSTQIVEGQQVGVTINGARDEHKNVAWSVGGNGSLINTGAPVYWADGNITITAYHPYNPAWSGTSHDFAVSTDQSDEESYRNSDLLWAQTSSSVTDDAVPLMFSHKLAKINVTLRSDDISDLSGATVSICGTGIGTRFNLSTGAAPTATGNTADIIAGTTTSSYTAAAIVVPQTVAGGTKFIKVELDGRTFHYTLPSDKTLKSGYAHNYTLRINENKTEIELEYDNISDWEDENITGDAEEEVATIPNNQIWYTTSNDGYVSLTSTTNNYGNAVVDHVYENGQGIITFNGGDLKSVGNSLFTGCATLTSVTVPNSVTHFESAAFYGCSSLASINIPDNVTRIDAAFVNCSALTKITIPYKVSVIDDFAFSGCSSLKRVDVKATIPPTIYSGTFQGCSQELKIYVPAGSIDAYRAANYWKDMNLTAE